MLSGRAPIDAFLRLKMARACRLLDAGAQSLAQQLGYEDSYYFSRVFRRVIGMLPSHYRALHHG